MKDGLQSLERLENTDYSRNRPEHADVAAAAKRRDRRGLRVHASVCGGAVLVVKRVERQVVHRELTVPPHRRPGHEREPLTDARVVDKISRCDVVRAVEHDRGLVQNFACVLGGEPLLESVDRDGRVEGESREFGAFDFGDAHSRIGVDDLPVEVAAVDDVGVDENEVADAGRC